MILTKLFEYNAKQINSIKALNKARYLLNDNEFNVYADYAVNKLSLEQLAKKYNLLNIKSFLNNIYDKLNNYSQNEVQRKSRQEQNNNIQDDNLEAEAINNITNDENKKILLQLISKLPEKYERILRLRYGIGLDKSYTLQEISDELGISGERVRQIENKSIEILKQLIKKYNYERKIKEKTREGKPLIKSEELINEEKVKEIIDTILNNSKNTFGDIYNFKMYYGLNDSGKRYSIDEIYDKNYFNKNYGATEQQLRNLIKRDIREVAELIENKLVYDDEYSYIDEKLKKNVINFLNSKLYSGSKVYIKSKEEIKRKQEEIKKKEEARKRKQKELERKERENQDFEYTIQGIINDILITSDLSFVDRQFFKLYYGLNDSGKRYSIDELYEIVIDYYKYNIDKKIPYDFNYEFIENGINNVIKLIKTRLRYDDKYKNINKKVKDGIINFLDSKIYDKPVFDGFDFYEE